MISSDTKIDIKSLLVAIQDENALSFSPVGISYCNLSTLSFGIFVRINQSIIFTFFIPTEIFGLFD